jgi:hypothetical protein
MAKLAVMMNGLDRVSTNVSTGGRREPLPSVLIYSRRREYHSAGEVVAKYDVAECKNSPTNMMYTSKRNISITINDVPIVTSPTRNKTSHLYPQIKSAQ